MEKLLTRKEAAAALGFAPQTLARYAWLGKGPRVTKVGRSVRYTQASLEAWVASAAGKPVTTSPTENKNCAFAVIGPRVIVDGQAYYREQDVAKAMHALSAVWLTWEPVSDASDPGMPVA